MFTDAQLLPISALQHLLFCERQCALIHVERLWAENRLTVEGRQLHRKAHDEKARHRNPRPGVRVTRGLQLVSHPLGLFGVADVVEFHGGNMDDGQASADAQFSAIVPIEYKRGRPKSHDADKVQLAAQAMCLEQMLDAFIPAGAIYYGRTRRRLDVMIDDDLRATTETAAKRLHEMIASGTTPTARREPKCDKCSLLNLCLPDALGPRRTAAKYLADATIAVLTGA